MRQKNHVRNIKDGRFGMQIRRRWESRTERYYVTLELVGGLFRKELFSTTEIVEIEDLIRLLQQGVAQAREWERTTKEA